MPSTVAFTGRTQCCGRALRRGPVSPSQVFGLLNDQGSPWHQSQKWEDLEWRSRDKDQNTLLFSI